MVKHPIYPLTCQYCGAKIRHEWQLNVHKLMKHWAKKN